jgi:serine/threonine protein kinase
MTEKEPDFTGTVFAGCKVISKLGQGGMGTVYLARHEALDKLVCVKLLSPELAREQRNIDFFLREARSAAKLEHPNIVHVYNFGQENGFYFLIMSYVEGKSLQDLVAEKGPLPIKEATDILTGILSGLAHAHLHTIIHRDIKPSNILVGTDGVPRIVDFGLARSISEEKQLTMAGEMVGTAYFMSPEQGLAGQVDSRADLYSSGATFFYILSGKYPFDGKSSIEVIHKHISDPVPNITLIRPDVPLWASRVIDRLMTKKPEQRYQTAGEVISDLNKYISGEVSLESVSNEKTFDIPEVTARLRAGTQPLPPASLERADPVVSNRTALPPAPPPPPLVQTVSGLAASAPEKAALQLGALHNGIKIAIHLALTMAATGLFILAGASGKTSGSLSSPFATSPQSVALMAGAGAALFIWALWQKPRKFTAAYAFFALAAAAAAYAGGAYIPAPEGADTVTKAFLAVKLGLENMFSSANVIVYALFLYLGASKIVYKDSWVMKGLAVAAYAGGLALTYAYFRAGAELTPEKAWLAAGGGLALLGLMAALTQKEFSLFFNPQILFLAANVTMFAMFTNPQVETITAEKVRTESIKAAQQNRVNRYNYQRAVEAAQAEVLYDEEGRQIEKKAPPPPAEVKPADTGTLRNQARREYYKALSLRISAALAGSAGIIFIALFLALMANACFIEELLAAYRESELI